jgi:hypothetical protein
VVAPGHELDFRRQVEALAQRVHEFAQGARLLLSWRHNQRRQMRSHDMQRHLLRAGAAHRAQRQY